MSAPFAPPPPPLFWVILLVIVVVALVMPFARREDWIGWLAMCAMVVCVTTLLAIILFAVVRNLVGWYRDEPGENDTPDVPGCYKGHVHELSWDRERFFLLNHAGDRVIDVPLDNMLDVIDMDALLVEEDIIVNTSDQYVSFPKSRSALVKILGLVEKHAHASFQFRDEIEIRREGFLRRSLVWFLVSSTAAVVLSLPIFIWPNPKIPGILWVIGGTAYGLAWSWSIQRFAYSIAWLFAAGKLQSILKKAGSTIL